MEWMEDEEDIVVIVNSCTCSYLTFAAAMAGADYVVPHLFDPTLAWCFQGRFH